MPRRLAVLISGSGSNLQALLDADDLGANVELVVSDRASATGLDRARRAGVEGVAIEPRDHADRPSWERALIDRVAAAQPDLVVLAGFMRILPGAFVHRWPTVNVHPSLLPAFPGARAVTEALQWGVKVTGCTVHYVDEHVDHGPIIAQEAVPVEPRDTPESLHRRIQAVEHRLLPAAVQLLCRGLLTVDGRHVRIAE